MWCNNAMEVSSAQLGRKDLITDNRMVFLENEMATHSSILAWKIPRTEEPGGQQSMASLSWTRLSDFTFYSRVALSET